MMNNSSSPMANFYRNQMSNISSPMGYVPQYQTPMPQYQQPAQQNTQPLNTNFPCRPVTSIEEARAAIIDASAPYVFTNLGNNEIYTKCLLSDNTAKLTRYVLAPEHQVQQTQTQQIEPAQNNQDIEQMKAQIIALNDEIIKLNNEIVTLKQGGLKNDEQSTANDTATNGKSSSKSKNS